MKKKMLLSSLCMLALIGVSVLGTLAYLTDSDSAVNTFTVGQVDIALDEADVNLQGEPVKVENGTEVKTDSVEEADRVKGNKYHLIPGQTYVKDPTVTVLEDSEEAFVRMLVKVNCLKELDAIFAPEGAELTTIFDGHDPEVWLYAGEIRDVEANTITYEFRYKETVSGTMDDVVLEPLFTSFTVPGEITGVQLETIKNMTITVEGHAIQAAGFAADAENGQTAEEAAWQAFEKQNATAS